MTQIINIETKKKPPVEVADIFRKHITDYQKQYKMPPEHYKVVYDILSCRTSYLGGHIERCDTCGVERHAYNSCRNRHCPKCQVLTKERWLEARKAELLPVLYFHNVFTLPHELNPVILCNKKVMLGILFKSVSETLLQFGKDSRNGPAGKLGFIVFLHTWDQKLNAHFHVHCLVPGGVLRPDENKWLSCENDYLFPVAALSKVFRGKFMEYLNRAYKDNELIFPGSIKNHRTVSGFKRFVNQLWSKEWVVHIEPPIAKPEHVLEYVGRYTHRVAISNNRIVSLENGRVTFTYKNRQTGKSEKITIDAVEFIRRFLLHSLPKGFMRIRHYGFLANRCKKDNIGKCRNSLGLSPELPKIAEKSVQEMMLLLTGRDITRCPCCGKGTMIKVKKILKMTGDDPFDMIHPAALRNTG